MDSLFDPPDSGSGAPPAPGAPAAGPLATRLRPHSLDEFVGQTHLLAPGSALRAAIESGRPHSMILYGPPGSGKTTLARLVSVHAEAVFEELSAVNAGKAEVRAVLERARTRRGRDGAGRRTIFFLDEIHRFNKAQQDQLLPAVEEGVVVLIGATTENPYFEVNSALLSRAQVYELQPLSPSDMASLLTRAAEHEGGGDVAVAPEAIDFLAARAAGDARTALNALELACETARRTGTPEVALADAEDAMQRRALRYDKAGDQHYDYISAWIKATRGSDPDASLYYLAAMLEGGEDPRFIVRRMLVLASEDIGNADPQALTVAVSAAHAVQHVGLPECQYALAQACVYLALAPKSNASYMALNRAADHIRRHGAAGPPDHLRDSHYAGAEKLGRGVGYQYPHDLPGGVSDQPLAPESVRGERFYEPTDRGFEAELAERVARRRGG